MNQKPDEDIQERNKRIRAMRKGGAIFADIAAEFGMSQANASKICKGVLPPNWQPNHTEKTRRFAQAIVDFMQDNSGRSPTYRDLAGKIPDRNGNPSSMSVVKLYVSKLASLGLIDQGGAGESRQFKIIGGYYFVPDTSPIMRFVNGDEELKICNKCGEPKWKTAYDTGDGWLLEFHCTNEKCSHYYEDGENIPWPVRQSFLTTAELKSMGYFII